MTSQLLLFTVAFLVLNTSEAQSDSIFKKEIEKAHLSFFEGILKEDHKMVDLLLADDVTLGFPHGGFSPKQEYIGALKNATLFYDSSANQTYHVRVYGNIGVVNGRGDLVFRYKEKDNWYKMLEHLSYTAVYVKDKNSIRMVAWQSNRPTTDSTEKVPQ